MNLGKCERQITVTFPELTKDTNLDSRSWEKTTNPRTGSIKEIYIQTHNKLHKRNADQEISLNI